MYLTLTPAAKERLDTYLDEKVQVILDLDDGVGKYSKMGVCSLDTSFRILLLNQLQDKKDYQMVLDSSIGEVFIKDYSKTYLDEEMTLDFDERLHAFQLKSPSGILDTNVPVVDLRV